MSEAASTPREQYEQRLAARRASAAALCRRASRLSNLRLALFALGLAAGWGALVATWWSPLWLVPLALAFAAAVVAHDSARRAATRAGRAATLYERGLARLEHRFAGLGRPGDSLAPSGHPYAEHLDLFGHGSLFELLSGAQTAAGEATLARWLLAPAPPEELPARHAAVRELRPRLDLREDLATLGPEVRAGLHPDALAAWGDAAPVGLAPAHTWAARALVAATLAALAGWLWLGTGLGPALGVLAVQGGFGLHLRRRVQRVIQGVERATHELELLAALLARLEREPFGSERLRELLASLETGGVPPSRRIAQLKRRVDLLDSRRNQLFAPVSPLLLWATQCALAIEAWRRRCGPRLGGWIASLGELEALADLASYAFEHPDDPFPEVAPGAARFEGEGLGHPLLPESACVRNDLALGADRRLLVVSGSNMSGKSTLLRTVGINAVLAQAGAPVRARSLRLSPLAIGASIRVLDSLQDGSSRFFTEIRTLRGVVELCAGPRPVLFLLDEILGGTNSHDRRVGAAAVVRGLVERGAVGLVTTHDLALAEIAEALGPRAANVHFEDRLVEGRPVFDYRLRPGVVERSNALELMRLVGLAVDEPTGT